MLTLFLTLALATASDSAQDRIDRGKAALENLDYDAAADEFTFAAVHKDATLEERVQANLYAGIAHRILGRDVDAKLNFVFVLKQAPETQLPPGTQPKISNFYDLIRLEIAPNKPATSTPVAPEPVAASPPSPSVKPSVVNTPSGVEPRPTSEDQQPFPILAIAGGTTAAVGAGVVLASLLVAAVADASLGDPTTTASQKEIGIFTTWGGLGAAALGAAVATTGGALLIWKLVE